MERADELTAEARIRRSALRLFAEHGFEAASVRAIAEDAGVSAGLVIHHYGSKAGLRQAVNDEVVRVMSEFSLEIHEEMDDSLDEQFDSAAAVFRAVFTARPELGLYIRRLFFDADDAGVQILDLFMRIADEFSTAFEARGWMRPAPDPEMRNLQLIIVDMGPVLFEPLLTAYFRTSPFDDETYRRWVAAQFDLFVNGVLTAENPFASRSEGIDQ